MPDLPQSLLSFGASLLTERTAWRLRKKKAAPAEQTRVLRTLLSGLAATAHGRAAGLSAGMDYATFRARLAPRTYEDFSRFIDRMMRGEADVLWPGRCTDYAASSGTTGGRPKCLPVTPALLAHFRRAALESLLFYTARTGHTGVFRGRHLFLGGPSALNPLPAASGFQAWNGHLGGIMATHLPPWVERRFYEPGREVASIAAGPARLRAIAQRTGTRDISLLAGIPSWALLLAETLRAQHGARAQPLQSLWPNLECFVHGGVPLAPFADDLRTVLGPQVNFHEVYAAAEALIAAQDATPADGLRLLTNAGVFYEFLPMRDFAADRLAELGGKAVPLEGVQTGVDYALLLTTPAGLCRYVVGDVVRFTSTTPPRLLYVGRTQLQLSAFGEHVIEKELTDALVAVCQRHGWRIVNFHVAPLFARTLTGQTRGRHEWWLELRPGTIETPTGPIIAPELDRELQSLNASYAAKRQGLGLSEPVVRLLMPGVFESWLRHNAQWDGHGKMPRCRSDRVVADELAQIARFLPD